MHFQEKEVRCDRNLLLQVHLADIKDYLAHAISFATREQLKARQQLTNGNLDVFLESLVFPENAQHAIQNMPSANVQQEKSTRTHYVC